MTNDHRPTKKRKRSIRSYLIVPDSNVLRLTSSDESQPGVNHDFAVAWKTVQPADDVSIVVPDVVFGELAYQQAREMFRTVAQVQGMMTALSEFISETVPLRMPVEEKIISAAEERVSRALHGVTKRWRREATPYAHIKWQTVVNDAIWRRPPFERAEREKGFRDYMILETVGRIVAANPTKSIVLISKDGLLMATARNHFTRFSHFVAYETIDQFTAFLSAVRGAFGVSLVRKVEQNAPARFYKRGDKNTYWYRHRIDDQLRTEYQEVLDNPERRLPDPILRDGDDFRWKPVSEPVELVMSARLAGLVGEREFRWTTTVVYRRHFERRSYSGLLSDAVIERARFIYIFRVRWATTVSDQGDFASFRLIGIDLDRHYRVQDNSAVSIA